MSNRSKSILTEIWTLLEHIESVQSIDLNYKDGEPWIGITLSSGGEPLMKEILELLKGRDPKEHYGFSWPEE